MRADGEPVELEKRLKITPWDYVPVLGGLRGLKKISAREDLGIHFVEGKFRRFEPGSTDYYFRATVPTSERIWAAYHHFSPVFLSYAAAGIYVWAMH